MAASADNEAKGYPGMEKLAHGGVYTSNVD
jgi:hypothetical protein